MADPTYVYLKILPRLKADNKKINLLGLKKYLDQFQDQTLFAIRKEDHFIVRYLYRNGDLTDIAVNSTEFTVNNVPCVASISPSLNARKGVITHPEIQYMTADEVEELIADPEIYKVVKSKPDSATAVIYWKRIYYDTAPTPPKTVKLGWDTVVVRPFVPRPIRCHNCQQYGHKAEICHVADPICARCATSGHTADDCSNQQLCCPACKGNHAATDPTCHRWMEEKQIVSIKQRHGISYKEALLRLKTPDADKNADKTTPQTTKKTPPKTPSKTPPKTPMKTPTKTPTKKTPDEETSEEDDDMSDDETDSSSAEDSNEQMSQERNVDEAVSASTEKRKDDDPPFQEVSSRRKRRGRGKP